MAFTPEEYKNYLQMKSKKSLLVEGRDDYYLIFALFDELLGADWQNTHEIDLDKAEILISVPGNKNAIESVVEFISNTNLKEKLAGFVDREFREFELGKDAIKDRIKKHAINGRLIWTRGHSAENYFLNEKVLRIPFRDISGAMFEKSFALFKTNIHSYLVTASAISLTAKNLGYIKKFRASVGWDIFQANGELDIKKWKIRLENIGFTIQEIKDINDSYLEASGIIKATDPETVRWFCDGHLSLFIIWCAFAKCVYETIDDPNKKKSAAQSILKYGDEARFNVCASSWAQTSKKGITQFPSDIFALLELV